MRALPAPRDRVAWMAIAVIFAIASWFVLFLMMGDGPFLGYINAGGFWFGALALIAASVSAARRSWPATGLGLIVGMAIWFYGALAIPLPSRASANGPRIRVISASLRNGNSDMAGAVSLLLAEKPTVIVVQEANLKAFFAALDRQSAGHWNHATRKHELIACRCNIVRSSSDGAFLYADLAATPGRVVRIWNVRAPKAYRDPQINQAFFHSLRGSMLESGPGIAAGDYNATPWNDGYRITSQAGRDTWLAAGTGIGMTFPTRARRLGMLFPTVRIDHMFATPGITPVRAWLGPATPQADHIPLVAEFSLDPQGS